MSCATSHMTSDVTNKLVLNFDKSMVQVVNYINETGPYDGIMAFSMGAQLLRAILVEEPYHSFTLPKLLH